MSYSRPSEHSRMFVQLFSIKTLISPNKLQQRRPLSTVKCTIRQLITMSDEQVSTDHVNKNNDQSLAIHP